ncbi:MAG TPA: hypothetical protein VF719_00825 [Abditibacteriaceae bacterium]
MPSPTRSITSYRAPAELQRDRALFALELPLDIARIAFILARLGAGRKPWHRFSEAKRQLYPVAAGGVIGED